MLKLECNFAYSWLLGESENHTNLGVTWKHMSRGETTLKIYIAWLRTVWNLMLSKKLCFEILSLLDSYTNGYALKLIKPMWYGTISLWRILDNIWIKCWMVREGRWCNAYSYPLWEVFSLSKLENVWTIQKLGITVLAFERLRKIFYLRFSLVVQLKFHTKKKN